MKSSSGHNLPPGFSAMPEPSKPWLIRAQHSRVGEIIAGRCRTKKEAFALLDTFLGYSFFYPLYVKKAVSKGRTKAEVDEVICWLTGHTPKSLKKVIDAGVDLKTFLTKAPRFNPKAKLVTGTVCGVRVEDVEDPTMRKIRYLDKLVDELAKGRAMEKILRAD